MLRPTLIALMFSASAIPGLASAAPEWTNLSLQFNVTDAVDQHGTQLAPFVFSVEFSPTSFSRVVDQNALYVWEQTKFNVVRTGATPATQWIAQTRAGYGPLLQTVPPTSTASILSEHSSTGESGHEPFKTYDDIWFASRSQDDSNPQGGTTQYGRAIGGSFLIGDGWQLHEPTPEGMQQRLTSLIGAPGFTYTEFYYQTALVAGSSVSQVLFHDSFTGNATLVSVSVVPEPASATMLLAGLAAVGVAARRMKVQARTGADALPA